MTSELEGKKHRGSRRHHPWRTLFIGIVLMSAVGGGAAWYDTYSRRLPIVTEVVSPAEASLDFDMVASDRALSRVREQIILLANDSVASSTAAQGVRIIETLKYVRADSVSLVQNQLHDDLPHTIVAAYTLGVLDALKESDDSLNRVLAKIAERMAFAEASGKNTGFLGSTLNGARAQLAASQSQSQDVLRLINDTLSDKALLSVRANKAFDTIGFLSAIQAKIAAAEQELLSARSALGIARSEIRLY